MGKLLEALEHFGHEKYRKKDMAAAVRAALLFRHCTKSTPVTPSLMMHLYFDLDARREGSRKSAYVGECLDHLTNVLDTELHNMGVDLKPVTVSAPIPAPGKRPYPCGRPRDR